MVPLTVTSQQHTNRRFRQLLSSLMLSLLLLLMSSPSHANSRQTPALKPRIAIIIDDVGNNAHDLNLLDLPGSITFAVLPHTPYARSFALRAHRANKQLMLHMPMETLNGNALGPDALTSNMARIDIQNTLLQALDSVPFVEGANNHMGSKLTQLPSVMNWVMQVLSSRQLYFIDSRTTEYTVAEDIAWRLGLATARRNVFLDNELDSAALSRQFNQLLRYAERHGSAIGIGHPYPETVAFLQAHINEIERRGIELVFASELTVSMPQ
ncbi:hypothetical protein A10D4_10336 [Idiomarina xiamenensis 10-D-4]|uniref:Divergent polysaccharide deacetylase family protein n=2 Tax=Idiomarina xiamenensis TaxID=1207041 RepID=K2K154_9GAMM|nr:hypothetical protein A10D4_10336 [Idiomarina xiamenensis 10-D-4]